MNYSYLWIAQSWLFGVWEKAKDREKNMLTHTLIWNNITWTTEIIDFATVRNEKKKMNVKEKPNEKLKKKKLNSHHD